MFWALSGTIFLGGSGAIIIGGLYWKKGTSAAAWVTMTVGLVMAIAGFILDQKWPEIVSFIKSSFPDLWLSMKNRVPDFSEEKFLFTGVENFFFTMVTCSVVYIVVSLLTCKKNFNMDRMLHRGKYAVEDDKSPENETGIDRLKEVLGISKNFSLEDKFIVFAAYLYLIVALAILILGVIYHLTFGIPESFWLPFWHGYIWVFFIITIVLAIWLGIGGMLDLRKMIQLLKTIKRDDTDDGRVMKD